MALGRIREGAHTENAEINMVPLIDVMLVLLVIFIITAPMVTQSVNLSLPKTSEVAAPVEERVQPQMIEITKEGEILLNQIPVEMDALHVELTALKATLGEKDQLIQLNIDETVPYDMVAKTLIEIKRAGLSKIGFATTLKE